MTKQELTNLVAEILSQMNGGQPQVKSSDYKTVLLQPDRHEIPASETRLLFILLQNQCFIVAALDHGHFAMHLA